MNQTEIKKERFPKTFWTANTIELFERAAYYSMASFVVIYLYENLGMSATFSTFLNGSLLWGLIYFLPILSGTLADKYGFKRSLRISFVLIAVGYFIMGNVQRFWPGIIAMKEAAVIDYTIPIVLAILLIGIGGSIVKPCIAGTIQKTSGTRATLGFGIFYMIINIGSITGRGISYVIRTQGIRLFPTSGQGYLVDIPPSIANIFTYAATCFALIGLIIVFLFYREPQYVADGKKDNQTIRKKTLGQAILGIFVVLKNIRFVFFLVVIGLFWFLYVQLYNLIPLFLRFIDPKAPVELYTLANPVMIVTLQLIITRMVKKWSPVKSITFGIAVTTLGMTVNVIPPLLFSDLSQPISWLGFSIPLAGVFLIVSIASMAVGEMMASPRIYEYLGSIAPKGEEGLYLGYANLPIALASIVGGPLGGRMFETFISNPLKAGQHTHIAAMWLLVALMGLVSMVGMVVYNRFLKRIAASK